MNKKGVSPVIATVLIVMITISAAALLVQFIIPFVKENLYRSTECINAKDYFQFYEGNEIKTYNCRIGNDALITLNAKNDNDTAKNIKGFFVVFGPEKFGVPSNDRVHMINYNKALTLPAPGEIKTYNFSLSERQDSAEIYTQISSGRICEIGGRINLEVCK